MLRPMRHFTPEEANAELEQVRPLVEELVAVRSEHVEALERQEELERKIRGNGGGIPPRSWPRRPPRWTRSHGGSRGSSTRSQGTVPRSRISTPA